MRGQTRERPGKGGKGTGALRDVGSEKQASTPAQMPGKGRDASEFEPRLNPLQSNLHVLPPFAR